jgi:hypothetical protein
LKDNIYQFSSLEIYNYEITAVVASWTPPRPSIPRPYRSSLLSTEPLQQQQIHQPVAYEIDDENPTVCIRSDREERLVRDSMAYIPDQQVSCSVASHTCCVNTVVVWLRTSSENIRL